jgi:hypothetical protein
MKIWRVQMKPYAFLAYTFNAGHGHQDDALCMMLSAYQRNVEAHLYLFLGIRIISLYYLNQILEAPGIEPTVFKRI